MFRTVAEKPANVSPQLWFYFHNRRTLEQVSKVVFLENKRYEVWLSLWKQRQAQVPLSLVSY